MFLHHEEFDSSRSVADIVENDYRTADVFQKYDLAYCCGGRWSLETACMIKGVGLEQLRNELQQASRTIQIPATLPFENWPPDFLVDYMINVHHLYLRQTLPALELTLKQFAGDHTKKYPYLIPLLESFKSLQNKILFQIREDEEFLFPYIRQVFFAWKNHSSCTGVFKKALYKPVDLLKRFEILAGILDTWRALTNNYTPSEKICTSHRVILFKLKELDSDLVQVIYLEKDILLPQVTKIEKDLQL